MVEVRYRGGFGDNLFQYCFGRLLAKRWGYELNALAIPRFPNTAQQVPGLKFLSPVRAIAGLAAEDLKYGLLIREKNLVQPMPARVILHGWFHRWEFYRDHHDEIRQWLETPLPHLPANKDDLAICIRNKQPDAWHDTGLYAGHCPKRAQMIPTVKHIHRLVERVPHSRLFILTDTPVVPEIAELNATVMPIDSFESWNFLRTCNHIALNVCHPSDWWAAWLSNASQIYAVDPWPVSKKSHCGGEYGCGWMNSRPLARPDLRVNNPQWIYEW